MTHVNFTTSGVALTDTQVARIREEIENTRFRSAWDNGVKLYALDILGDYSKMLDYAKETGGGIRLDLSKLLCCWVLRAGWHTAREVARSCTART